jgi:endonuclease/exonuclease/phosphatase family metal-dependent hydrolase
LIRVATINILNDLSRWHERRDLLARGLADLSLDLIALQEATDPLGAGTAHWLAAELGGYAAFLCPKTGWGRRREGIAILSRLPIERHERLDLRSQQRSAQLVRLTLEGVPVVFVNSHLYWPPGVHGPRVRQVERLLAWVANLEPAAHIILCGDFNATPGSPAIVRIEQSLTSAHRARHGREPEYTCPTPLVSRNRLRGTATRGMLRLFSNRPGLGWCGTLDYLFVSPGLRVVECDVILDRPASDDPTLYASDHFGLAATLALQAAAR